MMIQPDSTFWSPDDDRMLDIWTEHGYPSSNDVVHLLDVAVRLRNRVRQWQSIANELLANPSTAILVTRDDLRAVVALANLTEDLTEEEAAAVNRLRFRASEFPTSDEPQVTP